MPLFVLSARALVGGYRHFLPAVLLTWAVAGVGGGSVAAVPPLLPQSALTIVGFFFYTAAAARIADVSRANPLLLALDRAGACIGPLIVAFVMLMAVCVTFILAAFASSGLAAGVAVVAGSLFCLLILYRTWPSFSIPYFIDAPVRWSPAARAAIWTGPVVSAAVRLTRSGGRSRAIGTVFVLALLVLAAPLVAWRLRWGGGPVLGAVFFAAVLPYLAMFNMHATQALVHAWPRGERL